MTRNAIGTGLPIEVVYGGTGADNGTDACTNIGALDKAGGTMTGSLILAGDPVSNLEAATKQYADAIASGLQVKNACYAATTADLNATYTDSGGPGDLLTNAGAMAAFSVDGVSPPINSRILVKDQTDTFENGIYTLTTVGSGAVNWELTRATDYDTPAEIQPGDLILINNGTANATTSWIETATVATMGTDPIEFSQFTANPSSFAVRALSNLASTAINTNLISDTDVTDNLGSQAIRWNNIYTATVQTGDTAADTLQIGAWDVDGAAFVPFFTLTANNTPTGVLSGSVTGTTQAADTNNTTLATTAYADTIKALKANTSLNNLAAVAINTSLASDTDITDDLGTQAIRWRNIYTQTIQTGDTNADTLTLSGWDVDGAAAVPFFTITAGNTPTGVLSGSVTGTTQAPLTNNTTLATTAYVDAATGGGSGANTALSNLAAVAINTSLVSDTDVTDNLGTQAIRWNNIYAASLQTGDTAADTLTLSGWDVDGAAAVPFFTITAGNTPTGVLSGSVTGTTQAADTNNTTLATTAYADTIKALKANTSLNNLAAVAINTSLLPAADNAIDLGDGTHRFRALYGAQIKTGTTAADTLVFSARDVDGAADTAFFTLTAGNTPTGVLSGSVTGTTQAASDNSTKLATTAYADAQVAATAANKALSNLAAVAINTTLASDTDVTDDLGTQAIRWRTIYAQKLETGDTAADVLTISGWDVDGAVSVPFFTITAGNTPTGVLASSVTGTTQAADTNNTTLATTAYADTIKALKANTSLNNLASVAINASLISDTDVTDNLGSQAIRWNNIYAATLQTGDTAADTLQIGAWDVDGAAFTAFITLTANNTPTCALSGDVTGVTQSANDNSTKLATTAYVDAAGGGGLAAATQAEMEAATINTAAATPGRTQYHPGVSKCWVNANPDGTSDVSYNVTSITDVGTGLIGVIIATDFSSADFVAVCTIQIINTATVLISGQNTSNLAAGRSDFWCSATNGSEGDPTEWNIAMFGDQA